MKTIIISLIHVLMILGLELEAQVTIDNDGGQADPSAILDIRSTSQGTLLPRLTNIERDAINAPAEGLIIFNSDENRLQVYNGTFWKVFETAMVTLKISGNDLNLSEKSINTVVEEKNPEEIIQPVQLTNASESTIQTSKNK